MYLPVADVHVIPVVPVAMGFGLGLICAPAGISGAIYLLPLQLSFLGVGAVCASATNMFYNVLATPGGVLRIIRERRMCWPLSGTIVAGSVPGILLGVYLRLHYLPGRRLFMCFVGCFLLASGFLLGLQTLRDGRRALRHGRAELEDIYFDLRWIGWRFSGVEQRVNVLRLLAAAAVIGLASGAYGIGGAGILIPVLVLFFRIPVYIAAGSSLFANLVNSSAGLAAYSLIGGALGVRSRADPWLAILFAAGGFPGIYVGSRLQKHLPERAIRVLLALITLSIGAGYVVRCR